MNNKNKIKVSLNTQEFATALNKAMTSIAEITGTDSFKKFQEQAKEAAKQSKWATDPLGVMSYFSYFKLSKMRKSLSNFLYDLAKWVDADFID